MPPLQFVGTSGFNRGFQGAMQRRGSRTANQAAELELENARTAADRRRAIDEASTAAIRSQGGITQPAAQPAQPRGTLPPTGPGSPGPSIAAPAPAPAAAPVNPRQDLGNALTREFAARGLGTEAVQSATGTAATEAAEFDAMVKDLTSGNVEAAITRAQRNGMKITPALQAAFQNRWFQREFARAWEVNKTTFAADPRKLEKAQSQDTMRLLGELQGAAKRGAGAGVPTQPQNQFATPGRPTPTAPAPAVPPSYQPFVGTRGGEEGTFVFEKGTGAAEFRPGDVMRSPSGRGSGSMSVFEQKRQAYLALNPGDDQGALQYASGRSSLAPAQVRLAAERIANANAAKRFERDPAKITADADAIFARIMAASGQPAAPDAGVATDDPLGLFSGQ